MLGTLQAGLAARTGSAAWSPASLGSQLKGWFRADLGVTGTTTVTAWANQVSGGPSVTNNAGAQPAPSLQASGINGLPSLAFDGTQVLTNLTTNLVASGDRTVILIARASSTTGGSILTFRVSAFWHSFGAFNAGGAGTTYAYLDGAAQNINFTVQPTINATNNVFAFFEGPTEGLVVSVNNVNKSLSAATITTPDSGLAGFSIGGAGLGTQGWPGLLSEAIVTNTVLAGADLTNAMAYVTARYGIST